MLFALAYFGTLSFAGTSRYPWRYPAPPNWQLWQLDQTDDNSVKASAMLCHRGLF